MLAGLAAAETVGGKDAATSFAEYAAAATAGTRDVATSVKNLIAAAATAGQNDAATPLVQRTKVPEQTPEKEPVTMWTTCRLVHCPRNKESRC